jgi:hypothetical protein
VGYIGEEWKMKRFAEGPQVGKQHAGADESL